MNENDIDIVETTQKTIKIDRFKVNGVPTCETSERDCPALISDADYCEFTCGFTGNLLGEFDNYRIPCKECPVWKDEV